MKSSSDTFLRGSEWKPKKYLGGKRMKTRRIIAAFLSVSIILALVLSGCGNTPAASTEQPAASTAAATEATPAATEATPAASEKVELIYYSWNDEDVYMPALVEEFQKTQSDITVKYQSFPSANEEYYQKMLVMLASQMPVDVFGVNATSFYYTFLSRNTLAPLDGYIKDAGIDMKKNYGTLSSQTEVGDGKYFAMPHRRTGWPLYYNKDIFDEMKEPYPTAQMTWNEYLELSKKMTKVRADGTTQWGSMFAFPMGNSGLLYASQFGERLDMPTVPHYKEALEFYKAMYDSKSTMSFNEVLSLATGANQRAVFQNGDAAMYPAGDWNISAFIKDEAAGKMSINWDITYLPIPAGAQAGATIGCATNTGIATYSKNKDAAFKFLSYMCGEEGASVLASKGILPAFNSPKIKELYTKVAPNKSLGKVFEFNVMDELPKGTMSNDLVKMNRATNELYLLGEKTIDETLTQWEADRQALIAQNKQ